MTSTLSERRMAENEVYFRQQNENVQKGFENLIELANETGHKEMVRGTNTPLHFYCECSDENCRERVVINLGEYNKIHKNRNRFVIMPNHEVTKIEQVIFKAKTYSVVQKNIDLPEKVSGLNLTPITNT